MRRWAAPAVVCVAFVAGIALGRWSVASWSGAPAQRGDAATEELQNANRNLRAEVARLQVDGDVNRRAYHEIEAEFGELQDKLLQQQEDLALYRNVISPDAAPGLRVQGLTVTAGADPAVFRLHFTLAQSQREQRETSGLLGVRLQGTRDGKPATLEFPGPGATPPLLRFAFRYFQDLDLDVGVPAGFAPERVIVRIIPAARSAAAREESFPWPVRRG